MTKDERKKLFQEYMNKYDISYINAIHYICRDQNKIEKDINIEYSKAINDIIKNCYILQVYLGYNIDK
jgi:hypothetical protein